MSKPSSAVKVLNDAPVLDQVEGYWQKLAALILWKTTQGAVVRITAADIEAMEKRFAPTGAVIFTHGLTDAFEFSLVDAASAERIIAHDAQMRNKGGKPQ